MRVVLMRQEYTHDDKEAPGSVGKLSEYCMGIFPDFKSAHVEMAMYLFDELREGMQARRLRGQEPNIIVSGTVDWVENRDAEARVCDVSTDNIDYVFTAYLLGDEGD